MSEAGCGGPSGEGAAAARRRRRRRVAWGGWVWWRRSFRARHGAHAHVRHRVDQEELLYAKGRPAEAHGGKVDLAQHEPCVRIRADDLHMLDQLGRGVARPAARAQQCHLYARAECRQREHPLGQSLRCEPRGGGAAGRGECGGEAACRLSAARWFGSSFRISS